MLKVASGGSNTDAANYSPGRVPEAITVSSSSITDNRAPSTNYGKVVDIYAPGVGITSAWPTSDHVGAFACFHQSGA